MEAVAEVPLECEELFGFPFVDAGLFRHSVEVQGELPRVRVATPVEHIDVLVILVSGQILVIHIPFYAQHVAFAAVLGNLHH